MIISRKQLIMQITSSLESLSDLELSRLYNRSFGDAFVIAMTDRKFDFDAIPRDRGAAPRCSICGGRGDFHFHFCTEG